MPKGLLSLILDSVFDEKWVGRRGEQLTERELKILNFFGHTGKSLRNIYVPKSDGQTSEIDLVYITQKGIFVFESKNYSGWIFGDEKSTYWTAMLPNRQKNQFYNPILQNKTHVKWLRQYVGEMIPLFSIIVFSERCELKKLTVETSNASVVQRHQVSSIVKDIWNCTPDALTEEQIESIYEKLKERTQVSRSVKQEHVKTIKGTYTATPAAERTCPRCGKKLVLRTSRKGESAGQKFYGCSGFPTCRYTEKL